jgi:leader peptidase (prepilin peptidase)/N-methyltransferase
LLKRQDCKKKAFLLFYREFITILIVFYVTVLGLLLGSFANVISLRLHEKKPGIIVGKSACPKCNAPIRWYDNIPLLSWCVLLGKCRNCKTPISWQYPAVELFFGLLFFVTAIFTPSGEHILLIWRLVIVFALGIMMLSDIRYMDIPDKVSLPIIGFLLLSTGTNTLLLQTDGIPDFFSAAIGAGTIYLFFTLQIIIPSIIMSIQKRSYKIICCALASIIVFPMWLLASLLFLGKAFERFLEEETEEEMPSWIGGGDLRIAIIIGLALGWKIGILAVFLAYILGTIFALPLLALTKKTASSLIPFGPFLAIGLITCLFWGNDIWEWYIRLLGIV